MKCIKNRTTGEVRRVSNEEAWKLESRGWNYIPKSEWKELTRIVVDKPKVDKKSKKKSARAVSTRRNLKNVGEKVLIRR